MNKQVLKSEPIDCSSWANDVPVESRFVGRSTIITEPPSVTEPIDCSHWAADVPEHLRFVSSSAQITGVDTSELASQENDAVRKKREISASVTRKAVSIVKTKVQRGIKSATPRNSRSKVG